MAFFALYLGVIEHLNFNHYMRFNAIQAMTLDVLLVLLLVQRIFSSGYGTSSCCILGQTPYLPFVVDAAGRQL
ncbi:hypothetical protein ACFX2H_033619 [Malus domestica]